MRAFYRLLGERSAGGAVLERDGVLAAIIPACPGRSVMNAVVYERAEQLEAAHDELAAAYERAGVRAWTVWVPERDRAAAAQLERSGHLLDASPRAMTLELATLELDGAGELEWAHTSDPATIAAINESAYGLPDGEFAGAIMAMSSPAVTLYLAMIDGQPMACLGAFDHDGDCGIYFVATVPEARGRGLASALLRQTLVEARDRGCATSSLQATAAGFPIYERIGYLDAGAIEMWESRRS